MDNFADTKMAVEEMSQLNRIRLIEDINDGLSEGGRSFLEQKAKIGTPHKDCLSVTEVSQACDVSPATVRKWIDTGKLRGYRMITSMEGRARWPSLEGFAIANGIEIADSPDAYCEKSTLTCGQASKLLAISSDRVFRLIKSGELEDYFVSGAPRRFVDRTELFEFAKEKEIKLAIQSTVSV